MTHTVMKFVLYCATRRLAPMGDCRRGPRCAGRKRMTTASVPPITPSSVAGAAASRCRHGIHIDLKGHKKSDNDARHQNGNPDPVYGTVSQSSGNRNDRTGHSDCTPFPAEITAMNGIDDPAAAVRNRQGNHCKSGQRFLSQQQESGIPHRCGECRYDTAE